MFQRRPTATLVTCILAALLGSLQVGYHSGNVNAPAGVSGAEELGGGGATLILRLVLNHSDHLNQYLPSFSCSTPVCHLSVIFEVIEEFWNHTWRSRPNQSMPDPSLTLLWSLSVSSRDFGALLGSLGVKYLADHYGR